MLGYIVWQLYNIAGALKYTDYVLLQRTNGNNKLPNLRPMISRTPSLTVPVWFSKRLSL